MPIRKKAELLNLQNLEYIKIDDSLLSSELFDIIDFPEKLTAGKNLFKIRMQNGRFVDGSEVYIDVVDFNGNAIYYEPLKYVEKDGTRVISIYVYPDTPPGPARVFIAGRLAIDDDGQVIEFSTDPNASNFRNIPNALWSRSVPVAPSAFNTSEIIFTKQPSLTITEIVQPFRQPVTIDSIFTNQTRPNSSVEVIAATTTQNNNTAVSDGTRTVTGGSLSGNSPSRNQGTAIVNNSGTNNTVAATAGKQTTSATVQVVSGFSVLKTTNFPLSASMQGGQLTIVNPLISVPQNTVLNAAGQVLPNSQADDFAKVIAAGSNFTPAAGNRPLSGSYVFHIDTVLNKSTARISQISGFANQSDNTFGAFSVKVTKKDIFGFLLLQETVSKIEAATNVTASFVKPAETILTENSASFADIIIADTEPETGDVYRIKTLFKPSGQFGDFLDLGDTILEQQNILIDETSLETNVVVGSFYENFGQFESLQEIQKYWSSSVAGGISTNALAPEYNVDDLIGGVSLVTDWNNNTNQFTSVKGDAAIFQIKDQYKPKIYPNTTYVVRFKATVPSAVSNYISNDSNIPDPRLDLYINNDIVPDNPVTEILIGDMNVPATFQKSLQDPPFNNGSDFGTRVGSVFASRNAVGNIATVELRFKAQSEENLDIRFVLRTGLFIISDIEVLADRETGYTPNYVRIAKRVPMEHMHTPLSFKFQYFDIRGNKADLETVAFGAVFDGDNSYIQGTSNLLTGSLFIGNQVASGIEMGGLNSGFIRSVGYEGLNKAIDGTGPGGFLLYSGSGQMQIGDNIEEGVGLQLVGDNDSSHLIFTTRNGGSIDIKAEKFFIGTNDTQFISGSEGNIEISSSLFHLDPQNDLLVIGADAVINADLTVNSLRTPATIGGSPSTTENASSSIDSDGFAKFASASIAGFEVVSDEIRSANEALRLKASGDITASRVLLEGGTITSGVTILGSLSANSILTPATINGSPATPQNASSSISDNGLAIFRSASIAGFVVNTEEIKSSNESLRLKAEGQITGSNVSFSGGKIANWNIIGNTLSSVNTSNKGIILNADPSSPTIEVREDDNNRIRIFHTTSNNFGIIGTQGGNNVFLLGDPGGNGNKISSWAFNDKRLSSFKTSTQDKFGISIDADYQLLTFHGDAGQGKNNIGDNDRDNVMLAIGQLTDDIFGIKGFNTAGTRIFELSPTRNEIAGWTFDNQKLSSGNIIIDSAGSIQTADYASDLKGWKISAEHNGFLEVENAKIRGTLATAVFEKETVNAVGGQLYVANSTTLTASADTPSGNYLPTDATMSVVNVSGFSADEILSLKKVSATGFSTEYVKVVSSSRQDPSSDTDLSGQLFLIRGYGATFTAGPSASLGDTPAGAQSYSGSQVIVSTGKIGTGFIRLNANPNNLATPYMDIVERTGSGVYDVDLKVRLGDLKGLANSSYVFGNSNPGFGLATDNVFLQGGIIANTGSIGGVKMESSKLFIGAGNHANSDTGFFVDSGSNFSLGDRLVWDGSSLTVRGQLRLESGTSVDQAINEATASNTAKSLILTADSQVMTFASASATNAIPNKIIFSIAQQNLTGSISASNVTITTNQSTSVTNFTFDTGSITTNSAGLFSGIVSGSLTFTGNLNAGGLASDKDNFPVTINVSGDGFTDQTTIFKLEGGSSGSDGTDGSPGTDGQDGQPSINGFLTNESHTFVANQNGTVTSFAEGSSSMFVFVGLTNSTGSFSYSRTNSTGVSSALGGPAGNVLAISAMAHDSGSINITATSASISITKTMTLAKSRQGASGSDGSDGAPGSPGATGPIGPNFDFLSGSLSTIDTTGGLQPGLIMTSTVFGFHGAIAQGDGTNATLGDFTSYLDHSGSFYLGGGESGASTPDGGYFAWNNDEKSLLISGSKAEVKVDKFFVGNDQSAFLSGSNGNIEISSSKFHITRAGDAIVRKINATEGSVGGFDIASSRIEGNDVSNFTVTVTADGSQGEGDNAFIVSNFSSTPSYPGGAAALLNSGGLQLVNSSTNFFFDNNDNPVSAAPIRDYNAGTSAIRIDSGFTVSGDGDGVSFTVNVTNDTSVTPFVVPGANSTNFLADATAKSLLIPSASYGETGIQLEYNSGTPRAFIGKSDGSFFKFDGTNTSISSSDFFLGSPDNFISASNGNLEISSSNFIIDPGGSVTAKDITLTDFTRADYFVYTLAVIDSGNKAQFFENYTYLSQNYTRLVLDGSLGGASAQSVRITVAPDYPIGMIQPPPPGTLFQNEGHMVVIECAFSNGLFFASQASTGGNSGLRYGFSADSDDWFNQMFQVRSIGGVQYGTGTVGDVGNGVGRTYVMNIGQRMVFHRSSFDFRPAGISSYDITANGNINAQGLINFYSGLRTSNGPIGIGITGTSKISAGYAFEVDHITDRNGSSTAASRFHGNIQADANLDVDGTTTLGNANSDNTTITGRLLAGTLLPTSGHSIKSNVASGYVVTMLNDGNNSNRFGLRLQAGLDNQTYPNHGVTNYYMRLDEGDGGVIAYVTALNKNVTWGTFTGVHDGHVLTQDNINSTINENTSSAYDTGTIVVTVKSELSGSYQPDHYIVSSSTYQDKRVIGVYYSVLDRDALGDGYESIHNFASLGDGPILVCSQNGNIENGDYITTASGSGGYGCKQNDDLLHNYTVAKALEDVDWSTEPDNTKLISCTYHCG